MIHILPTSVPKNAVQGFVSKWRFFSVPKTGARGIIPIDIQFALPKNIPKNVPKNWVQIFISNWCFCTFPENVPKNAVRVFISPIGASSRFIITVLWGFCAYCWRFSPRERGLTDRATVGVALFEPEDFSLTISILLNVGAAQYFLSLEPMYPGIYSQLFFIR